MITDTQETELMETLLPSPREIIPAVGHFVLDQRSMTVGSGKEWTFAGERLIGAVDQEWGVDLRHHLSTLHDAVDPKPEEVDRPAWDGIWLKGDRWDEEIVAAQFRALL